MPNAARLQKSDLFLTTPELRYRSSQEHAPRSFTPTVFNAGAGTFDAPGVTAGLIGKLVVFEDGAARGVVRRVKSVSGTVATLDAAVSSFTGTTKVRAWLTPNFPPVASGNGTTTTLVAGNHANLSELVNSYCVNLGYFLLFFGGQNAGKAVKVTGFTQASGTYTFTPAITSTVTDEVAYLAKRLNVLGDVTAEASPGTIARRIVGNQDPDPSVYGTYTGSVQFELELRALTAAAGDATAAVAPVEMGDLLTDVFVEDLDTGGTVASAAGNDITATAGHGARFSVGGFVLLPNGQAGQIVNIATDVLTIGTGQITMAQLAASNVITASAWYKRRIDSSHRTRSFAFYRGGLTLQEFNSCGLQSLVTTIARDATVKFAWQYVAGEVSEYKLSRPVAVEAATRITQVDTSVPNDAKGMRFVLNGTAYLLDQLSVNWGFQPVPRPCLSGRNQMDGYAQDPKPVTVSFRIYADEDDTTGNMMVTERLTSRQVISMLAQVGTVGGKTFCVGVPALQLTKVTQVYEGRQSMYACEGIAVVPQNTDGSSAHVDLPPAAMGFL